MQQQRSKLCVQGKHLPQPLERPRLRRLGIRNPHEVLGLHCTASSPPLLTPPLPPRPGAPPVSEMHVHHLRRGASLHCGLVVVVPGRRRCGLHHNVVVPDEIDAYRHVPHGGHRLAGLVDGEGHEGGLGDGEAARGGREERRGEGSARGPLERGEGRRARGRAVAGAGEGGGGEAAPEAEQAAEAVKGAEEARGRGGEERPRRGQPEAESERERERRGRRGSRQPPARARRRRRVRRRQQRQDRQQRVLGKVLQHRPRHRHRRQGLHHPATEREGSTSLAINGSKSGGTVVVVGGGGGGERRRIETEEVDGGME